MDAKERKRINQQNAEKSTGPRDTQMTRHNALHHGLSASGLTDLDNRGTLRKVRAALTQEYQPQGALELFVLDHVALTLLRIDRANRLEVEFIQEQLHPSRYAKTQYELNLEALIGNEPRLLDPGVPAALKTAAVGELCDTYARYEGTLEKKLFRYIEQLKSLQATRKNH